MSLNIVSMEKPSKPMKTYRNYVESLCLRNRRLQVLSNFLSQEKSTRHACRVAVLDFRRGIDHVISRSINDTDHLSNDLRGCSKGDSLDLKNRLQGRIIIVEDLTQDVIELLGSRLDIDPLFFALHLHTTHRTSMK